MLSSDHEETEQNLSEYVSASFEDQLDTDHPTGRERSESLGSGSTNLASADFNVKFYTSITSKKSDIDDKVTLYFTPLRPNTSLGKNQGDHIIAHRLFLEYCNTAIKINPFEKLPKI